MSRSLSAKFGSFDSLNCRYRCGCRPCALQMRCTDTGADPARLRHRSAGPVGCSRPAARSSVRATTRSATSGPSGGMREGRVLSRRSPSTPSCHEPFLPAPDTGLRFAGSAHDLGGADAIGRQQDDVGAPNVLLRGVAVPRNRFETAAIGPRDRDGNPGSHAPDSHANRTRGIPMSAFRHDYRPRASTADRLKGELRRPHICRALRSGTPRAGCYASAILSNVTQQHQAKYRRPGSAVSSSLAPTMP